MQYVPFASDIEIPFYASLTAQKIDYDKLDDSARKILGLYEIRPADSKDHSCRMQIHGNALTNDEPPNGYYRAEGMIKNVNTLEDYRNLDKMAMLHNAARTIWDAINDGTIFSCPSLLASFLVLSYADLKKYRFSYWFAFPALIMEPSWAPTSESPKTGDEIPHKKLTADESSALVDSVQTWRYSTDSRQHGFFLAKKSRKPQSRPATATSEDGSEATTEPLTPSSSLSFHWHVAPLSAYETGFFEGEYSDDCYICFADPSNYASPGPVAPSWPLRNLLCLIRQRWKRDRVQILCYRETQSRRDAARSVILDMELPRIRGQPAPEPSTDPKTLPKVVGWERNPQGKLAGRLVDLTSQMDPRSLADSSVDLNLKLMKWRISPNLDLDTIKSTSCLLLGAGTLGSYVSRNLLGWGVRKITFVDNATVSFSNPVRQPLYNFNDCLDGGAKKAVRAAEALKEIYPGVDATGHVLSVPQTGLTITEPKGAEADFLKLKDLIASHDIIFLLMDTRESRWLPTLMGKAANKIVVNAALGFDTYFVMRHGMRPASATSTDSAKPTSSASLSSASSLPLSKTQSPPTPQPPDTASSKISEDLGLGCYFCNDIIAPSSSLRDLTLDQQCTVTRPGIAAIASALLVELTVSILQHPLRALAPAPLPSTHTSLSDQRGDHPLGVIPHQIRGFLSTFSNMVMMGKAYDCCSACSEVVIKEYEREGWEFVKKALGNREWLEEMCGLKEVQRRGEEMAKELDLSDDEEFGEDEGEGELV